MICAKERSEKERNCKEICNFCTSNAVPDVVLCIKKQRENKQFLMQVEQKFAGYKVGPCTMSSLFLPLRFSGF